MCRGLYILLISLMYGCTIVTIPFGFFCFGIRYVAAEEKEICPFVSVCKRAGVERKSLNDLKKNTYHNFEENLNVSMKNCSSAYF